MTSSRALCALLALWWSKSRPYCAEAARFSCGVAIAPPLLTPALAVLDSTPGPGRGLVRESAAVLLARARTLPAMDAASGTASLGASVATGAGGAAIVLAIRVWRSSRSGLSVSFRSAMVTWKSSRFVRSVSRSFTPTSEMRHEIQNGEKTNQIFRGWLNMKISGI